MAGGNPNPNPKGAAQKPSSSTYAHRKSRWESGSNRPSSSSDHKHGGAGAGGSSDSKPFKPFPIQNETLIPQQQQQQQQQSSEHRNRSSPMHHSLLPGLLPDPSGGLPQPPPVYGFHMLERRTIVLPDDSVRTYLALPPDYNDSPLQVRPLAPHQNRGLPPGEAFMGDQDYWSSLGLDTKGDHHNSILKRKYGGDDDVFRNFDTDLRQIQNQQIQNQQIQNQQIQNQQIQNQQVQQNQQLQNQQQQKHGFQRGGELMGNGFPFGGGGRVGVLVGTSSPRIGGLGEQMREDDFRPSKIMRAAAGGGGFENIGLKSRDVDKASVRRSYLYFAKVVNENVSQKKLYLEDSKKGSFRCDVCGRSSKEFSTVHELIMHTYNSDSADLRSDHLGLHKALCVLMGWNFAKPPDKSKTYQFLPAEEAEENQDDQIFWPPTVIVHNTMTGKAKDGRNEGLGNKAMDIIFREMGFANVKCKSQYNKEGHMGVTLLSFAASLPGLKDADNLEEYFLKEGRGRKAWAGVQSTVTGGKDDKNPRLVQVDEKTGDKKRVLYGYVATASDLDKLEADVRKKVSLESRREYLSSMKP